MLGLSKLDPRYLYGKKSRTSKAERQAKTAQARAAKASSTATSVMEFSHTQKENVGPTPSGSISSAQDRLDAVTARLEDQQRQRRKLQDSRRYFEMENRREIIRIRKVAADGRAARADKTQQNKQARAEKQARVVPILTVTEATHFSSLAMRAEGYMTVPRINEQLEWLYQHGVVCVPKELSKRGKGRSERLALWVQGVTEYVNSDRPRGPEVDLEPENEPGDEHDGEEEEIAIMNALDGNDNEEEEVSYDSDAEFYANE
ncbi:hypothetical protein GGX14DRAFT_396980 [Mycena pura]|uniref:Uncharacterized protein n=1 Tax=Mycena pura TaxID=153505 RepID=A0AAD6YAZ9_9AGAR|nr:hypothetical protein GGX14DRAFT_396980 [Mycena pura]